MLSTSFSERLWRDYSFPYGWGAKAAGKKNALRYLRGSLSEEVVKTSKGWNKGMMPQRFDHALYWLFTASLAPVLYAAVFKLPVAASWTSTQVAGFIAVGPVVAAMVIGVVMRDKRSPRWPFHKEGVVGAFGWHLVMCTLIVVLPSKSASQSAS